MARTLTAKILTPNEIEFMKEKVETLLSTKGIKIDHPQVMEILQKAGAEVEPASGSVKFPKAVIAKALQSIPKSFTLAAPDPQYDLHFPLPDGKFYTRTCTGGMNYLTEKGEYHNVTLEEVTEWIQLVNSLENINFCALPSTSAKSVPGKPSTSTRCGRCWNIVKNIFGYSLTRRPMLNICWIWPQPGPVVKRS